VESAHRLPAPEATGAERAVGGPEDFTYAWHGGPYEAIGQRFSIRCTDADLGQFLGHAYGALEVSNGGRAVDRHFSLVTRPPYGWGALYEEARLVQSSELGHGALVWLTGAVNRLITSQQSKRLIFHAAAASRAGRGVLLPAPMESGKSTLVAGLVSRGWEYLSDEAIAFDPDTGRLEGYAKPLSLDPGSWAVVPQLRWFLPNTVSAVYFQRQWIIPATDLGIVTKFAAPDFLVFPAYRPEAETELTPLSPRQTLPLAVASSFRTGCPPAGTLKAATRVIEAAPAFRLLMSDLSDACAAIESLFS
jgi:hypothetical protein